MVTKPSLELQTRADSLYRIDEVQINDVTNEVRIKYFINGNARSIRVDPPGFWARLMGHTMRDKIEKMKEEIQTELDKKKEEYIHNIMLYEAKQKQREESHKNLKKIADEMNAKIKKPNIAIVDDKPVRVVAELGNTMFYRENPYMNMQPVNGRHTHSALREKPRSPRPPAPAPQRPASRPTSYSGNSYRSNNGYDPNSPIYDYENDYNRNSGSSNIFGGGSIFGGSNNDNDSCRHNDGGYSGGGGGSSIDCSPGGDD